MIICRKLDAVADLTTFSFGNPDDPHLLTSGIGDAQNFRCSLVIADQPDLPRKSGGDIDCLRAIKTCPWTLLFGECSRALLAILNRTASVD